MARRHPARLTVEYEHELLPEDTDFHGNVMASGNAQADQEAEDWVNRSLDEGNLAAWCLAQVTAVLTWDYEGIVYQGTWSEFVGGCSFESEAALWENMTLWDDMEGAARSQAYENLRVQFVYRGGTRGERARAVLAEHWRELDRAETLKRLMARQARAIRLLPSEWAQQELVRIDAALEKL